MSSVPLRRDLVDEPDIQARDPLDGSPELIRVALAGEHPAAPVRALDQIQTRQPAQMTFVLKEKPVAGMRLDAVRMPGCEPMFEAPGVAARKNVHHLTARSR